MKAFLFHLRSSGQRRVIPPLTVLGVAVLFLRNRYWIGSWPETGAAAQVTAFFLSAITAGTSAWASGATRRHKLDEQLSGGAINPVRAEAFRVSSSIVLLLSPYLICQAIAFAFTLPEFPPGVTLWLGYVVMGLVVLLLSCAWGWLLGRYLSPIFAAMCAFLSWTIFIATVGVNLGLVTVSGEVWLTPNTLGLGLRLLVALLLLSVLTWALSSANRPLSAAVAVIVAAAGMGLTVMGTHGVVVRSRPAKLLCDSGAINLCLWPEHKKYLAAVRATNERVAELPNSFKLPSTMYEYGIADNISVDGDDVVVVEDPNPSAQIPTFELPEGSRWGLAMDISRAIISENLMQCHIANLPENDLRAFAVEAFLEVTLAGGGKPDYSSSESEQMAEAWKEGSVAASNSGPGRFDWAIRTLAKYKSDYCAG